MKKITKINKKIILVVIFVGLLLNLFLLFLNWKFKNNLKCEVETKRETITETITQTATRKPVPEDCLGSDWGSRERCLELEESVKENWEKIDLIGTVQDLGNLACPCFILKTNDGKSQSVRYGLFLPEQERKNIDVSSVKNGYRVRVVGIREKKIDPRAFVEILLDRIEIIDKK